MVKRLFLFIQIFLILISCSSCKTQPLQINHTKPNIIVIMTDDLDNTLVPFMTNTKELISNQGATLTNYFITSPYCCPSRASFFRGQYAHNTGILVNTPGFVLFNKNGLEDETLATWLNNGGYNTSLIGKYLNNYPTNRSKKYIPPGWSDWHVFLDDNDNNGGEGLYYNYILNENGILNYYGKSPKEYSTDVFKEKAITFMEDSIDNKKPFFQLLSVKAPHNPSIPAVRHANALPDIVYPKGLSFNESDITDKPKIVFSTIPVGDDFDNNDADSLFRKRAQTMLSVDEMVRDIILFLEQKGQLNNTYIFVTSDNGFHYGEHHLSAGKGFAYTEDIKVPSFVRGPNIKPGTTIDKITANIDFAATLADIANVRTSGFIDGRSFLGLLHGNNISKNRWRQSILLEIGNIRSDSSAPTKYRGIKTDRFLYVDYLNGEYEYYDLINDPYELNNIYSAIGEQKRVALNEWLSNLRSCKGKWCRKYETQVPNILN